MSDGTYRVGVLSLHNSKETKAILNAVEELGHQPVWLREENTAVDLRDGTVHVEPEVDVVANRLLLSNTPQPSEELGLASIFAELVPTLNPPAATLIAMHKFATAATLADAGIPVPDALLALSSDRLNADRERFGEEAVYKTAIGTHGGGTWKVGPDDPVNAVVGNRRAFLQEMIDHESGRHHDLRVYVVDDHVVATMVRHAAEGEWRTNVALGGEVTDAGQDLPDGLAETAVRASDAVGLDYAGVDVVEGTDGYYVLEVNPTAGFKGLFEATGVSPAPHIARLAIEKAGGSVDDERIQELSATLDDSVPACKPRRKRREAGNEPVVVGYTEEVVVTGTRGSESVVAKSDTGATRTSIDTGLAADVGAGPIKDITRVRSGSARTSKSRPVVDIVVGVGGTQHTVTASIEDRSHMDYPLLLGRDVLQHYQVNVRKRVDSEDETEE